MSTILQNAVRTAVRRSTTTGYVTPGTTRSFNGKTQPLRCNNKGAVPEKAAQPTPTPATDAASLRAAYRPNRFEQRMLVWTKKYKSLAEVPSHVK